MADLAAALGTPLMPWQRYVVDVALEIDPETGLLAYRTVLVSVPRQSGKTTLGLSVMTHRALAFGEPQRIIYTAQTRNDARRKWEDDHVVRLEQSPLASLFAVRKSNGSEAIKWANGSIQGISSTTEKAGHGETVDLAFIDEAFALPDDRVEQALRPAMITRAQPQMWIVSTAGTGDSAFLNAKQDRGRELVEQGVTSDFAYFEWSAPLGAKLDDEAVWSTFHPAVGATIDAGTLTADAMAMSDDEAQRAYFNWRNEGTKLNDPAIPESAWSACADAASVISGPTAFALDVSLDRSQCAVSAVGRRADGRVHVETIRHEPGGEWVVDFVAGLLGRHDAVGLALDPAGPAGSLIPALVRKGVDPKLISGRQLAQSCGRLTDLVVEDQLRHLGQPSLNAAVFGAARRRLGDAWAWQRRQGADICPLVAATVALWLLESVEAAPEPAPFVMSLGDL